MLRKPQEWQRREKTKKKWKDDMLAIVVLVPWTTRSSKKEAIATAINNSLSKSC